MKVLFYILLVLVSFSSASEMHELGSRRAQGSGWDDYTQAYDFGLLVNGYSNFAPRRVCDDFELDHPNMIIEAWVWMIYTGEQPSSYNLVFSEDDLGDSDPNTNTVVWAESVPCTNSFTGDVQWGYEIYETYCVINPGVLLWDSTHYYFETQVNVVDNCFILAGTHQYGDLCWYDDGSGVYVRVDIVFGEETDLFFVLGELLSLESETWGSIKTLF